MKKYMLMLAAFFAAFAVFAGDKIAVAEPTGEGVKKEELATFWSMLEANVGGDPYELISRSALQSMLTEAGLVESSDLTDLNSAQKAELGKLKTVKYLLVSKLGKLGGRYVVTLMLLDASTGELLKDKRTSETVESWTELADKLKSILRSIDLGPAIRKYNRSVVLNPVLRVAAPDYLVEDLSVGVEEALLNDGVKLQNLKTLEPILKKNKIGDLSALEPDMYAKVGDLLKVDFLVKIEVTRCSIRTEKKFIEVTQRTNVRHLGDLSGNVRIVSAQTGAVVKSGKFASKVDFDTIEDDTTDWENEDYGRYLVQKALPGVVKLVTGQLKK